MADTPVVDWNGDQVVAWLQSLAKFRHLVPAFQDEEITGEALMELTTEDLKSLGLTKLGPIKEFQRQVATLCDANCSLKSSSLAGTDDGRCLEADLPNNVSTESVSVRSEDAEIVPEPAEEWTGPLTDLTVTSNSEVYTLHPKVKVLQSKASSIMDSITDLLDDIMHQSSAPVHSQLSSIGISQLKSELHSPVQSLQQIDFSIAVIGLMKVGKSTLINAIMGQVLSPSRPLPMTTLPTFYRHKPGQPTPCLTQQTQHIARWVSYARTRFAGAKAKRLVPYLDIHLQDTFDQVLSPDFELPTTVHGAHEISEYLTVVNDILRIAERLRDHGILAQNASEAEDDAVVPSPLEELIAAQAYPLIEVEFACLRSMPDNLGTLTLVDTPGPDEAGQPVLEKAVKDTLRQASAVFAVLDYTRIGNQADAEMRQKFVGFFKDERSAKGRGMNIADKIIIILNKYEESGDISCEFARNFVHDLFRKSGIPVTTDHVFPVSALRALLASQFYHYMAQDRRKPGAQSPGWMQEYQRVVYPFEDYGRIPIAECVRRNEIMWEKARMGDVLNDTIRHMFSRIVPSVFTDALGDAQQLLTSLRGKLGCMLRATQMTHSQILGYSQTLQSHQHLLGHSKAAVQEKLQEPLDFAQKAIRNHFGELQGRMMEALRPKCAVLVTNMLSDVKLFESFRALLSEDQVFLDAESAQQWLHSTFAELRRVLLKFIGQEAQVCIGHVLEGVQLSCRNLFWDLVWELQPITDDFSELDLSIDIEPFITSFAFEDLDLSAAMRIDEESRCVVQRERRWYTLWLFGHHKGEVVQKEYHVRMEDLKHSLQKLIEAALQHSALVYATECEKQISTFKTEFFRKLEGPLEFITEQYNESTEEEAAQTSLESLLEGALARVALVADSVTELTDELHDLFDICDDL